jgi:hypothetical protein
MQVERRSFAAARDALRGRRCVLVGGTSGDTERVDGEEGGGGGGNGDRGLVFVAAEAVALRCRSDLAPALYRLPDELEPWQSLFTSLGKCVGCVDSAWR